MPILALLFYSWLKSFLPLGGVEYKDFNYFHELIVIEELAAIGKPGLNDALGFILALAIPPVIKYGSEELK